MCEITRLSHIVGLDKLSGHETGDAGEQLAKLFVCKYKPSYEDEAASKIEDALDEMLIAGVVITEADLNSPAFQGALFALVNKDLEWEER